jgi:hypothetical protein
LSLLLLKDRFALKSVGILYKKLPLNIQKPAVPKLTVLKAKRNKSQKNSILQNTWKTGQELSRVGMSFAHETV